MTCFVCFVFFIYVLEVPSDIHPSVFYYLLGKARNVMPEYDSEAQSYLSSAVKLNPSYVDAWNELGVLVWLQKIDYLSYKRCDVTS